MPVTAIEPARIHGVRFFAKILVPVLLVFILPVSGCDRASADHLQDSAPLSTITVKEETESAFSGPQLSAKAEDSAVTTVSQPAMTPAATSAATPATIPEDIMSAPLFTYDAQTDELRAYYSTFDNGAKYYTLSNSAAKVSGDYVYYTFTEFDLSIVYYFDADYSVWRVFNTMYMGEEATAENLKDGYKCAEFAVYMDCEDAVKNQEHLDRVRAQDAPSYRQWDNVLWYSFAYAYDETPYKTRSPKVPIEMNIDINKDGTPDTLLYDVNRNLSLNGGSQIYLLKDLSPDIYPIGVYVFDVNPDDTSLDFLFVFGSGAPGIDALAPSLWVRYDQGWIVKAIPYKQICSVTDNKIVVSGIVFFFEYRYITREFSVDKSYELTSTDQLFPFIEKFTVIAPIDAVFQKSDGTDHKGSLKAGTEIETTVTDYISKVYFVTASGEKGYFAVDSNLLMGTGGMQTYYNDCLKSDGYIGYNLIP